MEQMAYYNQKDLWKSDYMEDPSNRERFNDITALIPDSVKSILDVGCGNGSFLNYLSSPGKFHRLTGIDLSDEALKYVRTEKVKGKSSELPFTDKEFDLVMCLEVLEHLSVEDYELTLNEIMRVGRQFIIISVPNCEDLELSLVRCPVCQCRFNPFFHKRSFDTTAVSTLFQNAKCIHIKESGPAVKYRKLPEFLKVMTGLIKNRPQPDTSYCPQCGFHHNPGTEENINVYGHKKYVVLNSLLRAIRVFFRMRSKKRWLVSLYAISV